MNFDFRPSTFDPRPRLLTLDFRPSTSTFDPRLMTGGTPMTLDPRPMTLDLLPSTYDPRHSTITQTQIRVLLQHFLSVNPIFVVICGPKQPLQNCLSKASFMLFMFFKSTKWKHAYLLLPLKTRAVFAHAQSIFPPVPRSGSALIEIRITQSYL